MKRMTAIANRRIGTLALLLAFPLHGALAQSHAGHDNDHHRHHRHETPPPKAPAAEPHKIDRPETDHSKMDHPGNDHAAMGHAAMEHGPQAASLPKTPIPPVTQADRAAANRPLHHSMSHGSGIHQFYRFDRLEAWDADHGTGLHWEAEGWIGTDTDRLWLRSAGEREDGSTHSADLELLYGRSISPWWDVVAGVRHDFKPGDGRSFAAIGVMGLAPQKFEVEATLYAGEGGQTAFVFEAERELLLTNRLILQPVLEVEFHGRTERARGIGSGLGSIEAGLRLRYEITRRFAPYVGIVRERAFGTTAELRRDAGEGVDETRVVVGVRTWF
ncbi:MAG: copper resistance protein B [Lysobacter sp.]|nr:copper resistance protein B [Lysobacter sp.]